MKTLLPLLTCAALALSLTACQTTMPARQFAEPASGWQTKTGQLAYTDGRMSLIGEVLVRYSKGGDFELTFTKAGGITLLSIRQDANFAQAEGPLARGRWSGTTAEAPARLKGWFQLRDKIVNGRRMTSIRHDAGEQSFTLRF
ncbi:MAG: hypothetical protein AVDCRST_MAG42-1152 [uncultured Chthoniobacterales bacterium]|uniref:DUF306 domain-containing protein n=1 Tax=uncultured Chthoniobacterales bacterium TaxID=1836801 RepID=A0A6J4HUG3_9BACT|nr:MAG: hypothetical protein AVDCRST_MAG42-1152 [uncultured Chthoniobacterales bacterium]